MPYYTYWINVNWPNEPTHPTLKSGRFKALTEAQCELEKGLDSVGYHMRWRRDADGQQYNGAGRPLGEWLLARIDEHMTVAEHRADLQDKIVLALTDIDTYQRRLAALPMTDEK